MEDRFLFFFIGSVSRMMKNGAQFVFVGFLVCLATLLLYSCQENKLQTSAQSHPELIGTWVLAARISEGSEKPADDRLVRIQFNQDGTFNIGYKGEPQQKWIEAGHGAYSYNPPMLSLHWDSGRIVPLLLSNVTAESFNAHHGRGFVPLKDQEPEEIFRKVTKEKGPTRSGS